MKCPQCELEMKDKSYGLGDWDCDYPSSIHEEYKCKKCKIKYENGEWTIPKEFKPSYKQEMAILFICNQLNTDYTPTTNKKACKFINKYFDEAKTEKQNRNNNHCSYISNMFPENWFY